MNPPDRQPRAPIHPREGTPSAEAAGRTPDSRERALSLLRRSNRVLIAAVVAVTALFTELAAQAFPGKKLAANSGSGTARHRASTGEATKGASSTTPLKPPAEAPREPTTTSATEPPPTTTTTETHAEAPAQTSEPAPQTQESRPSETPATPQPTEEHPTPAPETAPPVVSGGS